MGEKGLKEKMRKETGRKEKIEKERNLGKNEYKKHRVSLMERVREKRKKT